MQLVERIIIIAEGALSQANTHFTYFDPGSEHWHFISIVNAAHSAELFIKAAIAMVAPKKIFTNPNKVINSVGEFDLSLLDVNKPNTVIASKLPTIYSECYPDADFDEQLFKDLLNLRNSVLHLYVDVERDWSDIVARFIFGIIDPLIKRHFNLYAVEYIEDRSVGYDYLVSGLIQRKIRFSFPHDFTITEIDENELLEDSSKSYRTWYKKNRP